MSYVQSSDAGVFFEILGAGKMVMQSFRQAGEDFTSLRR